MSSLELIVGPMFSGKTTELQKKVKQLQINNKKFIVVKHSKDNRYVSNMMTTHNFVSIDCMLFTKLSDINNINTYDAIVIDEGQFFTDLKETISYWLDNYNINIIIGGLDGDFQRKPIGQILELIPLSDTCIKLTAECKLCNDGTRAPFSRRIVDSTDTILIGGAESYIPVCRKHLNA